MRTCKHCGFAVEDATATSCPQCGAALALVGMAPTPSSPPTQDASLFAPAADVPTGFAPQASIYAPYPAPVPMSAPPGAQPARRGRKRPLLILGIVGLIVAIVLGSCGYLLYATVFSRLAPSAGQVRSCLYFAPLADTSF